MSNHNNLCSPSSNDRFRFKQNVEFLEHNSNKNTNCTNNGNSNNSSESVCKENTAPCQSNNSNSEGKVVENNITPQLDVLQRLMNCFRNNPERIPWELYKMYKSLQSHIQEGKVNKVNLIVHTLIALLNDTTYVTLFTPYALQIIALLLAYYNLPHQVKESNSEDDNNNDDENKPETKNKKHVKRCNVKIWIYGIAAAELLTALLTRLLQEEEEKWRQKKLQLDKKEEEGKEGGERSLSIHTVPSASFYSSCRLLCDYLNLILPVSNAMFQVRISGECKEDQLHACNASTIALNKLLEYLFAANSILPSLFNYPPSLALPSITKPGNNLNISTTNNITAENQAQPETSQKVHSETTHVASTPDNNSNKNENKETHTSDTIKELVNVLTSQLEAYQKSFIKSDGNDTTTSTNTDATVTSDKDGKGKDNKDEHESAERNKNEKEANDNNYVIVENDEKEKGVNVHETSSNVKASTNNKTNNTGRSIGNAVNTVLSNLRINSHLERAR